MKIYAKELADALDYTQQTIINCFCNYQLSRFIKGKVIDMNLECQKAFLKYLYSKRSTHKNMQAIKLFKAWCVNNKYKYDPDTEKIYNEQSKKN